MANRYLDWIKQSKADLRHAKNSVEAGDYEWSCFASQQAAEKALKAVCMFYGMESWGHSITLLLGQLEETVEIPDTLRLDAKTLDKHYIPTRYPNGFDAGAPSDYYTEEEARKAVQCAETIIDYCANKIGE